MILELELRGALAVHRREDMDSVLLFIEAPDFAELERRLRPRNADTDDEIAARMQTAREQVEPAASSTLL